jgi:hypothetical protein
MILYVNYFRDSNPDRDKEYLYCLAKNQSLPFVEKIYVFLESASDADGIPNREKLAFINLGRRLEFIDVFDHACRFHNDGEIICILNLDIFLDDSLAWANILKDFFNVGYENKGMVLKRIDILDYKGSLGIAERSWRSGKFCDGWLFRTPLNAEFLKEDFGFCVGNAPFCDNLMMHLMSRHYHTYSWGAKYRSFHLDICRKAGAVSAMITNDKTDRRPALRVGEHAMISADQDWDYLLQNKIPPVVRMKP